ncbi:MAG: aminotransferase class I/II-fold pyridoxal phosphate-dependent enzyme, partial [Planctomycetota bacterium]
RYDGREHLSPAALPALRDRTVTIMGLSKTFSITGWRLGYAFAPAALAKPITLANDLFYVCAPTPLQHGAAAGFGMPECFYEDMRADYARKRTRICSALDAAGLPPIVPQGAYYVLADATSLGAGVPGGARKAALDLLERVGVAGVPGSSFWRPRPEEAEGGPGERYIRFCYALEEQRLEEACQRLESLRS